MIAEAHPTAHRYLLGGLLAFGALNALRGGYYGLTGAVGVPTEWREGSPFADPGLNLLLVVGGLCRSTTARGAVSSPCTPPLTAISRAAKRYVAGALVC